MCCDYDCLLTFRVQVKVLLQARLSNSSEGTVSVGMWKWNVGMECGASFYAGNRTSSRKPTDNLSGL